MLTSAAAMETEFGIRRATATLCNQALEPLLKALPESVGTLRSLVGNHAPPEGRLEDLLSDPQLPSVLDYSVWLYLDAPPSRQNEQVQQRLVILRSACCLHWLDQLLEQGLACNQAPFDASLHQARPLLHYQIDKLYRNLPLNDEEHILIGQTVAQQTQANYRISRLQQPGNTAALAQAGRLYAEQLAYSTLPPLLLTDALGMTLEPHSLQEALHGLNASAIRLQQLKGLKKSLNQGATNAVVAELCQRLGREPDFSGGGFHLLGMAFLGGQLKQLITAYQTDSTQLAQQFSQLGLPRFAEAATRQGNALAELVAMLSGTGAASTDNAAADERPFYLNYRPALTDCATQALSYLTQDPQQRESWEVHRWGLFGEPTLTASLFPTGLVYENLLRGGAPIDSALVCTLLQRYLDSGCSYFDESDALPPDTDILSLYLRLAVLVDAPAETRAELSNLVDWVQRSLRTDGSLPVYLTGVAGAALGRTYCSGVVETECAVVEANLITALLHFDADRYAVLIDSSLRALVRRLTRRGHSLVLCYPGFYGGYALSELFTALVDRGVSQLDAELINTVRQLAADMLDALPADSAQYCAFKILGNALLGREGRFGEWATRICQGQRQDGGWLAEPLYYLPAKANGTSMQASRLLTSSFCWRAIQRSQEQSQP